MKRTLYLVPLLLFALLFTPTVQTGWGQSDEKVQLIRVVEELGNDLKGLEKNHENLRVSALKLGSLFDSLSKKVEEAGQLAQSGGGHLGTAPGHQGDARDEYVLQPSVPESTKNMQNENRQFTMISNIMKTKHDTAKKAINNVR